MVGRVLPNLGLKAFYDIGEDGWGADMSANILKLSVLSQGGVSGRVAAEPADAADGTVILRTDTGNIGVKDAGNWVYYAPSDGWLVYDRGTAEYLSFDDGAWAVLETGGSGDGGGAVGGIQVSHNPDEATFNYPNLLGFAWVNQRGATEAMDIAGTVFTSPQLVNGTYTHKVTAAPAGDFDVYARAQALFNVSGDYPAWSLSLRSSASGRGLHLGATPSNNTVYLQDVNDGGGFNGNRFSRQFNRMPLWYRISRRGTKILGYASVTGVDWNKVGEWDAGALAIDQIGFGFIPSAVDTVLRVLYFDTVAPVFNPPAAAAPPVEYFGDATTGGRVTADGYMEQWGILNGDKDVVFLRPFETVFSLQGSMAGFLTNVSGYSAVFNYFELTATGFKGRPRANNGNGTYTPGETFRWRAVGRVKAQGGGDGAPSKVRVGGFFTRTPDASEVVMMHVAVEDFGLPPTMAGSKVKIGKPPSAAAVFTIARNGVQVGTMTLAADGTATFASDGALVAVGDLLTVTAPADPLGAANVAFTLKGR